MPEQDHPAPDPLPGVAPGAASSSGGPTPTAPGDGAAEKPESELPPLTYPNSEQHQFRQVAEERRKVRIRNEVIFGVILLVVGVAFLVAAHNPALIVLALISAGAMVAYEMTVATLE